METMHKIMDRPLYTHCAGHSLGGHVCGFVGKLLKAATTPKQPMFDRISAMDPAGPLFFNDVAYPFHNLNVTSASRLERFDAILVDVIHTDGNARYLGYIPQVMRRTTILLLSSKIVNNFFLLCMDIWELFLGP
jgi:hypothetical protein